MDLSDSPCVYAESFKEVRAAVDASSAGIARDVEADAFLFPNAIFILDFLHIVFNAFEEAAKKHSFYQEAETRLRAIASFLEMKDLRKLFIVKCCDAHQSRFFERWSIHSHF